VSRQHVRGPADGVQKIHARFSRWRPALRAAKISADIIFATVDRKANLARSTGDDYIAGCIFLEAGTCA